MDLPKNIDRLPPFCKLLLAGAFYSGVIGRARPSIGPTLNSANFLRILSCVNDSYPLSINIFGPAWLFEFFFTITTANPVNVRFIDKVMVILKHNKIYLSISFWIDFVRIFPTGSKIRSLDGSKCRFKTHFT